jgi:hypothetical protein
MTAREAEVAFMGIPNVALSESREVVVLAGQRAFRP